MTNLVLERDPYEGEPELFGRTLTDDEAANITTDFPLSKRAKRLELTASDQVFTRDSAASSPASARHAIQSAVDASRSWKSTRAAIKRRRA